MRNRLAMLQVDPLNRHRCPTTFGAYGSDSSFVQLARRSAITLEILPSKPDRKGKVAVTTIRKRFTQRRKEALDLHSPAGFTKGGASYPLLVLFDGDRNVMWIPRILDILIAQGRIPPMVAIMTDDSVPSARRTELPATLSLRISSRTSLFPGRERTTTPQHNLNALSSPVPALEDWPLHSRASSIRTCLAM